MPGRPSRAALSAASCAVWLVACATEPTAGAPVALSIRYDQSGALSMAMGTSVRLPATVRDAAGDTLPLGRTVHFASRDPAIVAVDASGLVASRRPGVTWVVGTADVGGRRLADSVQVYVVCTAELTWELAPLRPTIAVGESFTPRLELRSCGGHVVRTDTLTWATRDTSVAQVDAGTGRTVGRAPGRAVVVPTGRRYGPLGFIDVTVVR